MKKLPIGMQTFKHIREGGYAYVDKTGFAVDVIKRYKYVFLSRPRRFGKSLFLDTLSNIFSGNRELFAGLQADTEYDWNEKYPVIRISFGGGGFRLQEHFFENISSCLQENEESFGISSKDSNPDVRLRKLIRSVAKKHNQLVVILVDEYDKPILDNIDKEETASLMREYLKGFYSVIKESDRYIRFVFLPE